MTIQFLPDTNGNIGVMRVVGRNTQVIGDEIRFTLVPHLPRIVCHDGTDISVQASRNHYCSPRNDGDEYTEVEVGFPSAPVPYSWYQYCDAERPDLGKWWRRILARLKGYKLPTDTVYGYVPVRLVWEYIESHGGAVGGKQLS